MIRVYTKQPGKPPDMTSPFTCPVGSTLVEMPALVHRDFAEKLKSARIWGTGVFDGQTVDRDHVLHDKDVVESTRMIILVPRLCLGMPAERLCLSGPKHRDPTFTVFGEAEPRGRHSQAEPGNETKKSAHLPLPTQLTAKPGLKIPGQYRIPAVVLFDPDGGDPCGPRNCWRWW